MTWRNKATFGTVKIKKSLILDGGSVVGLLGTNGKEFWVDSGIGTDGVGRGGQKTAPVATFDYALDLCTADQGDVIHLMEGHAETLATAGAIAWDVDGITVVVHGEGDSRPTFTFSNTAATIAISGNSAKTIGKMILVPSVDNVVSPIVISGTDVDVEFESRDASAAVEFIGIVLTTTAAHKLAIDLKHIGFSGGAAGVTAIELIGVEDARINVDYYGISATAIVEMTGTASNDVLVTGTFNNIGTTDLSLSVVDTITGSTWAVDGFDAAAGVAFSGGDGNAIAVGDLSVIAAGIVVIDEYHDVPAQNNTNNAQINEVIGNKTDAAAAGAVTTTDTLVGYIKQLVSAVDLIKGIKISRTAADVFNGTQVPIFTVATGRVLVLGLVGEVSVAAIDGGASNTSFVTNPTVGTDMAMCAVLDINADENGSIYSITGAVGDALHGGSGGGGMFMNTPIVVPEGTIDLLTAADVGTGGALGAFDIWYIPLDTGAVVTAV